MSRRTIQLIIQVVLGILIVVLSYVLYVSITGPYAEIRAEEEVTEQTRERMTQVRTVLNQYREEYEAFPPTLDSLLTWVEEDPEAMQTIDSIFGSDFVLDTLVHSPRTGNRFEYEINDTLRLPTYLLEDPDSDDHIGTLAADITEINAASWE